MKQLHVIPGVEEKVDPDIVQEVLRRVIAMSPGFSLALAQQIEQQVKAELGGRRVFVPKGAQTRLTPEQQLQVYQDGLSNMPTPEIQAKHKISRASLYRLMKRGPGG
jgi:Mor family transcriptional regulator